MPVLLSRRDAQLAAAGCRSLAYTLRSDAERQSNAKIREQTLSSATGLERLAQLFEDHAVTAMGEGKPVPVSPVFPDVPASG
jgi:hypothetical protein